MKDKYWAKNKYSTVNPTDYNIVRFASPAGKIIDEAEKCTILELLKRYAFHNSPSRSPSGHLEGAKKLKILDVATGPGRLAFYLEKHFPFAEITGVDINYNMLEKARKFAQENKSKVKFTRGDIYNLLFKDGQFNAVVGLRFSMHLPNPDKVIKELSRVLTKDGLLIFDIFNYNSVLRLRGKDGYYTLSDLSGYGQNCSLRLAGSKGIFLLGETIIRKLPYSLLPYLSPLINPPVFIQMFSTKLILCFKKL